MADDAERGAQDKLLDAANEVPSRRVVQPFPLLFTLCSPVALLFRR